MTGTAPSSPWIGVGSKNTGSAREPAARGKVHYFFLQRQSAFQIILPAVIIALVLISLTFGVHVDEIPKRSDAETRHGYYMLMALAAIPIWYKLPITIPLIAEAISAAIAWYVFCSDDHPDFSISPHSIWGLSWMKYRRYRWSQIERVEVIWVERNGWFSRNSPATRKLTFFTSTPMSFPIIGNAMQLNHTLTLNKGFSENDKDQIIDLIREFAPDQQIVQKTQVIDSQF